MSLVFRKLRNAVIADFKNNLSAFKDVVSAPRRITDDFILNYTHRAPCLMVAWIGMPQIERLPSGLMVGPFQMAAHILAEDRNRLTAEDAVLDLSEIVVTYLERHKFNVAGAGLAVVKGCEHLWDAHIDKKGYSLASITWEQPFKFGTDAASVAVAEEYGGLEGTTIGELLLQFGDGEPESYTTSLEENP